MDCYNPPPSSGHTLRPPGAVTGRVGGHPEARVLRGLRARVGARDVLGLRGDALGLCLRVVSVIGLEKCATLGLG